MWVVEAQNKKDGAWLHLREFYSEVAARKWLEDKYFGRRLGGDYPRYRIREALNRHYRAR